MPLHSSSTISSCVNYYIVATMPLHSSTIISCVNDSIVATMPLHSSTISSCVNYFIVATMPLQNIIINYHLVCELLYSGYYALTLIINY